MTKKASPGRPANTPMADSLTSRLADLDVGASDSRAVRLPLAEATSDRRVSAKDTLTGSIRKAVERAKLRNGGDYIVETGDYQTRADHVIVCAVVTRVA